VDTRLPAGEPPRAKKAKSLRVCFGDRSTRCAGRYGFETRSSSISHWGSLAKSVVAVQDFIHRRTIARPGPHDEFVEKEI
jgi:hypothetical protein